MDWYSPLVALLGVIIGGWIAPWMTSHLEKERLKRSLQPELVKLLFSFYKLLKEKAEIVNTLSMDERAATIATIKLTNDINNQDLKMKLETLTGKINRKTLQYDSIAQRLIDVESAIHSTVALIGIYFNSKKYNKTIGILEPFFNRLEKQPYLYDYINITIEQYNTLAGPLLQKEIIAFGKQLDAERKLIINNFVNNY